PCHSRFGSPISAGTQPLAAISQIKTTQVSQKARFGRPDKAKPPSGNGAAEIMPDGATLIRPTWFRRFSGNMRLMNSPAAQSLNDGEPAIDDAGIMPDGANAYPAYVVPAFQRQCTPYEFSGGAITE
uniref:hypothetical protein n=1 Tax=uncultured Kosakonia sp. TaxID=1588927 RepID=UPI0025958B09